jgi:hypothetical protein
MFGLFKKKPQPIKNLVGKVHAFYKFQDGSKGEFVYNLFESSEGKRTYEIEVISNHQLLYKYYTMTFGHTNIPYHFMLATQHKFWSSIIEPWILGGDLNPKYFITNKPHCLYVSRGLKQDINKLLDELEPCPTINAIRAKLNAATEA